MKILTDSTLISPKRGEVTLLALRGRFYADEETLLESFPHTVLNEDLDYIRINDLEVPLGVEVMTTKGFKPTASLDVGDVLIVYVLNKLNYPAPKYPLKMEERSIKTIKQFKSDSCIETPLANCIVNGLLLKGIDKQ